MKALFGAFCGLIVALLAVRSLSANIRSISVIERVMAGGTFGGGVLGVVLGLLFWALVVALMVGLWVWLIQLRNRR